MLSLLLGFVNGLCKIYGQRDRLDRISWGAHMRGEQELLRVVEAVIRTATSLNTRVPQRLHAVKLLLHFAYSAGGQTLNDTHISEATVGLDRALPHIEQIAGSQRLSRQTRSRAEALATAIRGKREVRKTAPATGNSTGRATA